MYQQRFGNGVITLTESDPQSGRASRIQTGWPTSGGLTGFTGNIQDLEYAFDTRGNLYSRTTGRTDVPEEYSAETFTYDNLNRLKTSDTTWDSLATRSRSYNYDPLGNLTYRSDIGTLTYDETNNAGVHAVTAANGQNYHYDAYGNMVQRGADLVEYDVFNKPIRIGDSYFSYGPDHARFKQESGDRTTYYINGGLYEEIIDGTVTTTKSYVGGYFVRAKTAGQTRFTYLHKDHLGSVDAMTDQWGNLIDRMSFDPWGLRQYADWADRDPTGGDPGYYPTTEGFTGHEMLDQVNLIHMNGRVYDPVIGRFLSPDIDIQAPFNTQSFNRYSYVFNNPLSLIDPSGYNGCTWDGNTLTCPQSGGNDRGMTLTGANAENFLQSMAFFDNGWGNAGCSAGQYGGGCPNYSSPDAANNALTAAAAFVVVTAVTSCAVAEPCGAYALLTYELAEVSDPDVEDLVPEGKLAEKLVDSLATASRKVAKGAPDFVVSPNGAVFPVPKGAQGPEPVINPAGKQTGTAFTGGAGGANGQVSTMRIMSPTPGRGNSPGYPNGYIKYENSSSPKPQGVDPYSGKTLPNSQSHFPID